MHKTTVKIEILFPQQQTLRSLDIKNQILKITNKDHNQTSKSKVNWNAET